ncbi:MAG: DUF63 family protein [Candidatus Micrarchaeia archaeon]
MGLEDFISEYFVRPIVEYSGYNIVNTLTYAIIAMVAAYLLFIWLRKKFTKEFILYLIPFILFGSTVRVITDSIYTGVAQKHTEDVLGLVGLVVNSHLYDYGFWTVTPGIYILTAVLVIISILLSDLLKRPKLLPIIGILLFVPHFIVLIPMFVNYTFIIILLTIASVSTLAAVLFLGFLGIKSLQSKFAVFAHSLDGAATLTALSIFNKLSESCLIEGLCYREEHVFGGFLAGFEYGMVAFLLIKIAFAVLACYFIERELKNENTKNFIFLLIIIFGLAPGVRDALRLLAGT